MNVYPFIINIGPLEITGFAQHVPELDQELGCLRPLRRVLQLELQQPLDHVDLAEVPVDRARVLQRLQQRWVQLVGVLEVLERLDRLEELVLQDAPQLQVEGGLLRGVTRRGDALLQLLGQTLPISYRLELIQTLRKIHGLLGSIPIGDGGPSRGTRRLA